MTYDTRCPDCPDGHRPQVERREPAAMMALDIRATDPYGFRSGEWARLTGVEWANDRPCYRVRFPDGAEDSWVVNDASDPYEFRPQAERRVSPERRAEDRERVDEYAEETAAAMNYGQGYAAASLDLRQRIEQADHDYALHDESISPSDGWTSDQMDTYSATVAGVLALLQDEPTPGAAEAHRAKAASQHTDSRIGCPACAQRETQARSQSAAERGATVGLLLAALAAAILGFAAGRVTAPIDTSATPSPSGALRSPEGPLPTVLAASAAEPTTPVVSVSAQAGTAAQALQGVATWYDAPSRTDAAAGPLLRKALGKHWRGRWVTVDVGPREALVRLTDFCACSDRHGEPTILDLDDVTFARLSPLNVGVIEVEVRWEDGPRVTAPPTDVSP